MKKLHLLLLLSLAASVAPTEKTSNRPNIIIMMVDDMGFSDPGCFGGEVQTPNLDALAENGLRFTQFYNAGRCCPTRASLLTGLYPHQAGIGQMTFDKGEEYPGYRGTLGANTVTIAEVLKESGYQTGMVGKWHLSITRVKGGNGNSEEHMKWLNKQAYFEDDFADPATYPTARGFEKYYGNIWGVVNFFDPFSLVHGTEPVGELPDDYYITDAISDSAVAFIDQFARHDDPFFLYVAHCAPHWPLHAKKEDIAKYRNAYTEGWQEIRQQRFQRQLEMDLFDKDQVALSPASIRAHRWEEEEHQAWESEVMATHAAMIDRVDQGLGRIVKKLKALDELDNTIILFLSDNGASPERYGQPGFDRTSETREGKKVHYLSRDHTSGPETTYNYIGQDWANVANTPFKYWKRFNHEGGICTPFVAHWPNGMAAEKGSIVRQPHHVIDLMATCVDLAQADYPKELKGMAITPFEGQSLSPIFDGQANTNARSLMFEHYYARAFRQGHWKLVAFPGKDYELYNISEDRTEINNLASSMPEKVVELADAWEAEAKRINILPQPQMGEHIRRMEVAYE